MVFWDLRGLGFGSCIPERPLRSCQAPQIVSQVLGFFFEGQPCKARGDAFKSFQTAVDSAGRALCTYRLLRQRCTVATRRKGGYRAYLFGLRA